MGINNKRKQVLIDLYTSQKGLFAFTLYGRYGLSPAEAVSFIEEFQRDGIVVLGANNRIILTSKGRKEIKTIINSIHADTEEDNSYLSHFITEDSIEINAPYLPNDSFYSKYTEREADNTSQ